MSKEAFMKWIIRESNLFGLTIRLEEFYQFLNTNRFTCLTFKTVLKAKPTSFKKLDFFYSSMDSGVNILQESFHF